MLSQEALTYIIGILVIVGTAFSAFNFLRKPQERGEINDAVVDEKIANLKLNTDEKISGLKELILNLRDNHIHTLQSDLTNHISENRAYVEKDIAWKSRVEVLMENIGKK